MIGTARELEKRGEPINWEFIEAPIRTAEDVERDRELMRALNYGNKEILLKSGRNKNKNIVG